MVGVSETVAQSGSGARTKKSPKIWVKFPGKLDVARADVVDPNLATEYFGRLTN